MPPGGGEEIATRYCQGGLRDLGSPGEAEKGKGRVTPRILATATGQNEAENSGREPDVRCGARNS